MYLGVERDQRDALRRCARAQKRTHFVDRDCRGVVDRIAIDAAADRWKGDGPQSLDASELQRAAITAGEQRRLAVRAAAPHRADGMDDIARRQPEAGREPRSEEHTSEL